MQVPSYHKITLSKMNKLNLISIAIILLLTACTQEKQHINIYSIGDSTMANKTPEAYPETGWGQVLGNYFDNSVTVHNHAVNGRSSKSFIGEGRWDVVKDSLQSGDYVLIQFGHNDQKFKKPDRYTNPYSGYRKNLTKYVKETREKGANPILITSIVRRNFNEYGTLIDTHTAYTEVTRTVAKELNVPLIDLNILTEDLVISLGEEQSTSIYNWVDSCANYPQGKQDNTHLNVEGANAVAKLAIEAMKENVPALASRIK
jgi:lysophospholipase L1-like esterase